MTLQRARAEGVGNFSVLCNHVRIAPALRAILDAPEVRLDGLIGPGHVSTVIGTRPYEFVAREYGRPVVVSGFEPVDILQSIVDAAPICSPTGGAEVENQYTRAVRAEGNPLALAAMAETMELREEFEWRGLGTIPRQRLPDAPRVRGSSTPSACTTLPGRTRRRTRRRAAAATSCAASASRATAASSARPARRSGRSARAWSPPRAPAPRTTRTVAPRPDGGPWYDTGVPLPIERPGKIVAVGLNYREHAEEQARDAPSAPMLFAKWQTALIGPDEPIVIPPITTRVDFEGELGVVIGERVKGVSAENALEAVRGYVCVNDVSARDLQRADRQYTRAKSLDTFCPVGPLLVPRDEVGDPGALRIRTTVNSVVMQDATTAQLIHSVPELIAYVSQAITLEPGDLICTGTPSGVGEFRDPPVFLGDGDEVAVEIERVGVLRNPVRVSAA